MSLLRAFVALEIPASLQDAIHQQTAGLRASAGPSIRWVTPRNLHLTLKFLGDVPPSSIQFLNQMLAAEAAKHPRFNLAFGGLGAFPSAKRARVIWIGIQAPPDLGLLQRNVEAGAAHLGYKAEERPFSPHLTIGRVRQTATASEQQQLRLALDSIKLGQIGNAWIDAISLMKSDLQPTGSVYTRLSSAPLQ